MIVKKIKNYEIVQKLENTLSPMVGKECWQVTRSYGGEYNLHLGSKLKTENIVRGEWIISTYGTNFLLKDDSKDILVDTRKIDVEDVEIIKEINSSINTLVSKKLTLINIDYHSLSLLLEFGNKSKFEIIPTLDDDNYDLPYWEVLLPNNFLRVGRERTYSMQK